MLDADESHHLTRVLRLAAGSEVFVFDGEGSEWLCEVSTVDKRSSSLRIVRKLEGEVESPLQLTLGQALIKNDKFDWVVQKSVELGVTRIAPLITDHCDIRRAEGRTENRLARWRRIALEAVKQCGRRTLVEISEPVGFPEFCHSITDDPQTTLKLLFSERGGRRLSDNDGIVPRSIVIVIAPEGGWSDGELEIASRSSFDFISLGRRILRSETAAIAATALTQNLFGDL